jgi:hypothetical protein
MISQTMSEACNKILEVDGSVRYVYVLGLDGKEMYSKGRYGAPSRETEDATPDLFVKMAIGLGMAESENQHQGRLKSIVVKRERLRLVIYVASDKVLLISTEPEFPVGKIIKLDELVESLHLDR